MAPNFLIDGPDEAKATILLAHGAGAPMDSPAMTAIAKALAGVGLPRRPLRVRLHGRPPHVAGRKPPPRAETLMPRIRGRDRGARRAGR